jgi:hypothetical protein
LTNAAATCYTADVTQSLLEVMLLLLLLLLLQVCLLQQQL